MCVCVFASRRRPCLVYGHDSEGTGGPVAGTPEPLSALSPSTCQFMFVSPSATLATAFGLKRHTTSHGDMQHGTVRSSQMMNLMKQRVLVWCDGDGTHKIQTMQ